MTVRLRRNGARLTAAHLKLLRERERAWLQCRLMAAGISHLLTDCFDADDLLLILDFIPGLANAARVAKDYEERFKWRMKPVKGGRIPAAGKRKP